MTKEKEITWWSYLLKGISYNHALAWYREIKRTQSQEEADLFKKRVNWINKKNILN